MSPESNEELQKQLDTLRREKREEDVKWRSETSTQLGKVVSGMAELKEMMTDTKDDVRSLQTSVYGPDGKSADGLQTRMVVVEKGEERQTWFNRLMIVTGIGMVASWIKLTIGGK